MNDLIHIQLFNYHLFNFKKNNNVIPLIIINPRIAQINLQFSLFPKLPIRTLKRITPEKILIITKGIIITANFLISFISNKLTTTCSTNKRTSYCTSNRTYDSSRYCTNNRQSNSPNSCTT